MDAYSRKARFAPAALAALPALILLGGGALDPKKAGSIVAMLFGAIGIVICGIVRDLGRRLQPGLWATWGGSPTLRRLRHRDATDPTAVQRLHRRLEPLLADALPTVQEEQQDPERADRRYEEAIATFRERTRDRNRFRLVFAENVEYGFRRNCLGLRPVAIAVAGAILAVSALLIIFADGELAHRVARYGPSGGVAALAIVIWWKFVTANWVRRAAEIYADRLLEATTTLGGAPASSR